MIRRVERGQRPAAWPPHALLTRRRCCPMARCWWQGDSLAYLLSSAELYDLRLTLSAAKRRVDGINTVRLTWSGATSANIDVYRDGVLNRDDAGRWTV